MRTARWYSIVALFAALALGGCASDVKATGNGTLGQVGVSSGPLPSGAPSTGATPSHSGGGSTTAPPPSYPKTAKGYADATINAYDNHRAARLADLSSPDTVHNFGTFGHPDRHWHFRRCDGAAGTSYCMYDNNNGDRLTVMVTNAALGKPHAVSDVALDVTKFAADINGYVSNFTQAWTDGNVWRMKALATISVAVHFAALPPPQSTMLTDTAATPDADHTRVEIYDAVGGHTYYVEVRTGLLGHAHAIDGVGTA